MADDQTRLDLLDRILGRNLQWVSAADSKVAPILALDTGMLGVIAALFPKPSAWSAAQVAATSIATALLLTSMIAVASAVFPRLEGPKGSKVFFGGVAQTDRDVYVTSILAGITSDLLQDFAKQCHRNAEIAETKFHYIRWAMILLFCSIVPWLIAVGLLYNS